MRAVNLLPPNAYAPKQRLPHAPLVLASTAPVLVGAMLYLGWSVEHSKVVDRQNRLGAVQSQIAELGPSPQLVSESAAVEGQRTTRETALNTVLSDQIPWDVMFGQVSRVLPANAWLTTLTATSPTPSGGTSTSSTSSSASAQALSIEGYTYSQQDVAEVLTRLALVPSLSDVTLQTSTLATVGNRPLIQFTITASISGSAQ